MTPSLSASVPAHDPAFQMLKQRIISRTGHAYYDDKDPALWERIRRRLSATGRQSCADYLRLLDHQDRDLGAAEWQALESEITIGETFFFRYAEQFNALRQTILPEIVRRNRDGRRIRIWSAGCATGAEPYSVAIVLRELLGAETENWSIRIIGTDINEAFLETARAGIYGNWSLRALSPEQRLRYFIKEPQGDRVLLKPEYRGMVLFQQHNLLSLLDHSSPLQFSDFDLILCRNVLIYFRMEDAIRVMSELGARLTLNGWLLAGTADPGPVLAGEMRYVPLPGTASYRRMAQALEIDSPPPAPPARPQTGTKTVGLAQRKVKAAKPKPSASRKPRPIPSPQALAVAPQSPVQHEITDHLEQIRTLAGRGDLAQARSLCREALAGDPVHPVIHYYDGVIAQAMAQDEEAEAAFRKALYLDRQFAMAHYQLGVLLVRKGNRAAGVRHLQNAIEIARKLGDDETIPEGGGLSAAELSAAAMLHLEPSSRNRSVTR